MKRVGSFFLTLSVLFGTPIYSAELCEYALYTPEAFHVYLQNELPRRGIVPLRQTSTAPGVIQTTVPLVRDGFNIVGYMEFKEDVLNSTSSLLVTDIFGSRLFEVREMSSPYRETIWLKHKETAPIFRISSGSLGLYHYYYGSSIGAVSWKHNFENELEWLMRVLGGVKEVKPIVVPYTPESQVRHAILTDPDIFLYADQIQIKHHYGILSLEGRVNDATYHALVSRIISLGYTSLDVRRLIIDTSIQPVVPYSPRLAACL